MKKTLGEKFSYTGISYGLLLLTAGTLPFTRFLMLPIAILWLLLLIVDNRWKEHFGTIRNEGLLWPFGITISFFLLCLIGTIYSDDVSKAISDWECKLWFLAAPLCILPLAGKINSKKLKIVALVFCLATTATAIGNIVISSANFARTGDVGELFYINATHFKTHPSYLSMYCTLGWVLSILLLLNNWKDYNNILKICLITSIFLLPVEIFFLQSKAGLLLFGIIFICMLLHTINHRKRRVWISILVMVLCTAIGVGAIKSTRLPMNRISESIYRLQTSSKSNPDDGTSQRIAVWQTACEITVKNLPFGTGTGDATEVLCQAYEEKGYTYILDKKLNCHNQYLQYSVSLGIAGIAALLLFIGYLAVAGIRKKSFILVLYSFIIGTNMLVESMLETRAGSNFIPVMALLLLLYANAKQKAEEDPDCNQKACSSISDGRSECDS